MNHQIKKWKAENGITYFPIIAGASTKESMGYQDPKEINPTSLPVGRISVPETITFAQMIQDFASDFSTVQSKFPLDFLEVMQNLSLVNPDVSQAIDNIVQLGNTGHSVFVEGVSQAREEEILLTLGSFGDTAFAHFGGLDGFVNSCLGQIGRSGAISVEWVVKEDLSGIDYAIFVPVQSIRFVYDPDAGKYKPYQKTQNIGEGINGLIQLNDSTYQYCAMQLLDNSPYAIPPILAALESIMIQRDVIKNLRFVAKKLGLLGFITFMMKAPPRITGESDSAYVARCEKFLAEQADRVKSNYRDGIALGFKDMFEVQHNSVMSSADGAAKIFEQIELQVFSGLKADPALHGRTYSTTETYAGVVYEKMLSILTNYQRTVKAVLEYGYKLQLKLLGIDYSDLYVEFNPSKSLSDERDENTYNMKLQNLQLLYNQGIIDQNQFAQEAGYSSPVLDEPRDPLSNPTDTTPPDATANQKIKFIFNRKTCRYSKVDKPKQPSLELILPDNEEENYEDFTEIIEDFRMDWDYGCDCITDSFARNDSSGLAKFVTSYFRAVYPAMKNARTKAVNAVTGFLKRIKNLTSYDSEQFADEVYNSLASEFGSAFESGPILDRIRRSTNKIYRFFRLEDKDPFGGADFPIKPSFDLVDKNAVNFIKNSDEFYFGKFVTDQETKKSLKNWLADDYLQNGRSIRDPGELDSFRKRFGNRVGKEDYKVLRVVETSVSRAKNWGNTLNVAQAKGYEIEIVGPKDNLTCPWCSGMVGKVFKVAPVVQHIKDTMARSPEDLPQLNPFLPGKINPKALKSTSEEQLLAQGIAVPPYHPHCRHRHVVKSFE